MKILIIGGSGVIGSKFIEYALTKKIEFNFTYHMNKPNFPNGNYLDITNKNMTYNLIKQCNPDVVIHTTALSNVDLCETNHSLANSINVHGTNNVIEGCRITNSKIVYFSSSFVFDGKRSKYLEFDQASPSTYYGLTKFRAEEMVKKSNLSYLILRTDQPYCWIEKWQHTNSVIRVLEGLKKGKELKEIIDWYNTPTYVPDFVEAAMMLIEKDSNGIFHVVGSEFINRFEWSRKIVKVFNLDWNLIIPIKSESLNLPAKRPNVYLDNKKLCEKIGRRLMNIEGGLRRMKKEEKSNFFN